MKWLRKLFNIDKINTYKLLIKEYQGICSDNKDEINKLKVELAEVKEEHANQQTKEQDLNIKQFWKCALISN